MNDVLDKVPIKLGVVNNPLERILFIRLEGKILEVIMPTLQVFQLRTSSIARYLEAPVTYRARVLVILFDLASGNL